MPSGIQLGTGVRTAAVYRITDGGGVSKTDNPLDLAIQGRGYFQIELPEGKGIGRLVREKCDFIVSLPMKGKINSLNASVAAGILMYEVASKRNLQD